MGTLLAASEEGLSVIPNAPLTRRSKVDICWKTIAEISIPKQPQDGIVSSCRRDFPVLSWLCKRTFLGLTRVCATAWEAGTAQITQFVCIEELAVQVLRLRMVGVVS